MTEANDITDSLVARLDHELDTGGVVMYKPYADAPHSSFVFADSDMGDHGMQGNALIVPKSAITPAVEDWIDSHCTWFDPAGTGDRRTPMRPLTMPTTVLKDAHMMQPMPECA
jgi:hypothetical protein